jgi:aerobic carbon-monoxide dehydrogenase large subunit
MPANRCADARIFKFLTGNRRYVDDIRLPGMLYLAILRSPHAHARITGVDLSVARAAAGVRLALAGADLAGKIGNITPNWVVPGTVVPERPVMAPDRVHFVGECVALAVAETREAAYDALERIEVAYEAPPVVIDEKAAIGDGAPRLHEGIVTVTGGVQRVGEVEPCFMRRQPHPATGRLLRL